MWVVQIQLYVNATNTGLDHEPARQAAVIESAAA